MKAHLVVFFRWAEDAFQARRDDLTPEERRNSGAPQAWEPKMQLAHLFAWERHMLMEAQS